uniref:Reverse transcriptase domain-containing protein n=1 Tax=Tanacetum cinerariifolium TaxID=118510 RepID=A0A699IZM7_TANCI|nr:hypothetical protein [Tanacetum cinerariifolium]
MTKGGMFKRLGSREKSVFARSDSYNRHSHSRYTKALSESEDSRGGHWKLRLKKKKSSGEDDDLSQTWAAVNTERWVMPTWCHMFNSTLTGNARVWFDLPPESIDIYDDLKKNIHGKLSPTKEEKWQLQIMKERRHSHHGNNMRKDIPTLSERKQDRFSLLTKTLKEIFALDKGKFKAPPPMTTSVEKRNHAKFCEFHGEVGHNTDECMHIRKQIEEMLKARKLSYLIKEIKQNNRKEQPKEDERTEGPMIIEAEIRGHCVHRMYVDNGLASKIMYEHCFSRLRLEIKMQLIPATTPLIGFSGEIIWPIGQIQLLVKIRDEEHSALDWINFMCIPVEGGVITLKSSKLFPLECAMVSGPVETPLATKPIAEERVKVAINLEYPEQTVMIGCTLTEEGCNKLCGLLQRNLYIFAWKPANMTDVPRHIVKHCLNVREGCSSIRQKKRGQAADRNQAIQ